MKFAVVSLKSIDFEDERFRISWFFSLDVLKNSINKVGLLYPPLVVLRDGKSVPVSGWKRLLAVKDLGYKEVPVLIVDKKDDLQVFQFTVEEKMMEQDLSLLEKAVILAKSMGFGESRERILQDICPMLGLPARPGSLAVYLNICDLEENTRRFIHEYKVSLPVVEWLLKFSAQERKVLLPFLAVMGQNKQKEILENLYDLLKKEDMSLKELFGQRSFSDVLSDRKMIPLEKAEKVRSLIRALRYPSLSEKQMILKKHLKLMKWPENISFSAPPFFEGDSFRIQIPFKNEKEAGAAVSKVSRLMARKEFSEMMDDLTRI